MTHRAAYKFSIDWNNDGYKHPASVIPTHHIQSYTLDWGSNASPNASSIGVGFGPRSSLTLFDVDGRYFSGDSVLNTLNLLGPHDWKLEVEGQLQYQGRAVPILAEPLGSVVQPRTWALQGEYDPALGLRGNFVRTAAGTTPQVVKDLTTASGINVVAPGITQKLQNVEWTSGSYGGLVNAIANNVGGWAINTSAGIQILSQRVLSRQTPDGEIDDETYGFDPDITGVGVQSALVRTRFTVPAEGGGATPQVFGNESLYGRREAVFEQWWETSRDGRQAAANALAHRAKPDLYVRVGLTDIYSSASVAQNAARLCIPGKLLKTTVPSPTGNRELDFCVLRTRLQGGFDRAPTRIIEGIVSSVVQGVSLQIAPLSGIRAVNTGPRKFRLNISGDGGGQRIYWRVESTATAEATQQGNFIADKKLKTIDVTVQNDKTVYKCFASTVSTFAVGSTISTRITTLEPGKESAFRLLTFNAKLVTNTGLVYTGTTKAGTNEVVVTLLSRGLLSAAETNPVIVSRGPIKPTPTGTFNGEATDLSPLTRYTIRASAGGVTRQIKFNTGKGAPPVTANFIRSVQWAKDAPNARTTSSVKWGIFTNLRAERLTYRVVSLGTKSRPVARKDGTVVAQESIASWSGSQVVEVKGLAENTWYTLEATTGRDFTKGTVGARNVIRTLQTILKDEITSIQVRNRSTNGFSLLIGYKLQNTGARIGIAFGAVTAGESQQVDSVRSFVATHPVIGTASTVAYNTPRLKNSGTSYRGTVYVVNPGSDLNDRPRGPSRAFFTSTLFEDRPIIESTGSITGVGAKPSDNQVVVTGTATYNKARSLYWRVREGTTVVAAGRVLAANTFSFTVKGLAKATNYDVQVSSSSTYSEDVRRATFKTTGRVDVTPPVLREIKTLTSTSITKSSARYTITANFQTPTRVYWRLRLGTRLIKSGSHLITSKITSALTGLSAATGYVLQVSTDPRFIKRRLEEAILTLPDQPQVRGKLTGARLTAVTSNSATFALTGTFQTPTRVAYTVTAGGVSAQSGRTTSFTSEGTLVLPGLAASTDYVITFDGGRKVSFTTKATVIVETGSLRSFTVTEVAEEGFKFSINQNLRNPTFIYWELLSGRTKIKSGRQVAGGGQLLFKPVSVTGLSAGTGYLLRAAIDSAFTKSLITEQVNTEEAEAPEEDKRTLRLATSAARITDTTVRFTASVTGVTDRTRIYWRVVRGNITVKSGTLLTDTAINTTVAGLAPSTNYRIEAAFDSKYQIKRTGINFSTKKASVAPLTGTITRISRVALTHRTVRFVITATYSRAQTISWRLKEGNTNRQLGSFSLGTGTKTLALSNLKEKTAYKLETLVGNKVVRSSSFTTPAAPVVRSVTSVSVPTRTIGDASARVNFTTNYPTVALVYWRVYRGNTIITTGRRSVGKSGSVRIAGLTARTGYRVELSADSRFTSKRSVSFTTTRPAAITDIEAKLVLDPVSNVDFTVIGNFYAGTTVYWRIQSGGKRLKEGSKSFPITGFNFKEVVRISDDLFIVFVEASLNRNFSNAIRVGASIPI